MRKFANILAALCLLGSSPAWGFQSIETNYIGLGKSPLGMYLQHVVPNWSDRFSKIQIKDFVSAYYRKNAEGRPTDVVATEIGFDCSEKINNVCTYDGVYTYELGRPGFPAKRAAILINLSIDFNREPWEVQGTRTFLYGGIKN